MARLVTGASGFLGGKLVQRLVAGGAHDIALLSRSSADLSNIPDDLLERCQLLTADDTTAIVETVRNLAPDVVYHCASRVQTDHRATDVDDLIQSNLGMFAGILEGLARSEVPVLRMINLGTYLEHDASGTPDPNSLYAATKLSQMQIAAFYAKYHALRLITLKPSLIYGPGERRPRLMRILVDAALSGRRIEFSPGEQILDFVHVEDVVSAILVAGGLLAAEMVPLKEAYFVLSGEPPQSLRDIVRRIETMTGRTLDIAWGATPYKDTEVMVPYLHGPGVPGWQPVFTLDSGIRDVLNAANNPQGRENS